jgi:hypothetical protein
MAAYCSWLVWNSKFILCLVIAIYCTSFVATQNVNFSYDNFGNSDLTALDDAEIFSDYIELNVENASFDFGVGRILHPEKVQFQDVKSKTFASFSTFFTFSVNSSGNIYYGAGISEWDNPASIIRRYCPDEFIVRQSQTGKFSPHCSIV